MWELFLKIVMEGWLYIHLELLKAATAAKFVNFIAISLMEEEEFEEDLWRSNE